MDRLATDPALVRRMELNDERVANARDAMLNLLFDFNAQFVSFAVRCCCFFGVCVVRCVPTRDDHKYGDES